MKEFNLESALNGDHVMLRNGCKAIVYYKIPDEYVLPDGSNPIYPLRGLIFNKDGFIKDVSYFWHENGLCNYESYHPNDIIGMYEEPKINIENLPKPFKPKSGDGYYYINEYGVQFTRHYDEDDDSDVGMAENAQCFRTREDAQKWLDFMKSMME